MIWQTRVATPDGRLVALVIADPARPLRDALEEVAHALDLIEHAAGRDDENLVEAQLIDPFQPHARLVGRADQRHRCPLGEASGFGVVGEIDQDIGEDGIGAAGLAIEAHARSWRSSQLL